MIFGGDPLGKFILQWRQQIPDVLQALAWVETEVLNNVPPTGKLFGPHTQHQAFLVIK